MTFRPNSTGACNMFIVAPMMMNRTDTSMNTFKIGDRVKFTEQGRYLSGLTGYVTKVMGDTVLVDFGVTVRDWWVHTETLVKAR